MRTKTMACLAPIALILAISGCGAGHKVVAAPATPRPQPVAPAKPHRARPRPLVALVTAQTQDQVLAVDLPSGHVAGRVIIPGEPDYVAAAPSSFGDVAVIVSSSSGRVTLLDRRSLRAVKVFGGFSSPHIPAISPDGNYAYVSDDATGRVTVIGLDKRRILARAMVGAGAHHLAFSSDWRQVWIALGQAASTIAILSGPAASPRRPHVLGRWDPGFLAHDLLFSPDATRVWITSADTSRVGVFNATTHRLLFTVAAGAPPQHLVFAGRFAYITSGYGSLIEKVRIDTGQVVRRVPAPYGSFDLDAAGGYVVTASLLRGTLAIYDRNLRLLHVRQLAPSAEDVAIVR
jgi:DNA-binding beta-propeller fold protein YncE